ncbi:DUF502 domain-containing protein [Haloarcula sp. H-GB4]|uniref:DUF502 domain-containing protein n=1 Tax=Haloarcula sp. H-GB4 TaxID=3069755 RepID=UPI0027B0BD9D|nr:DUF502 domain-containing protein [Haloarcula sp. H-GB4]MDQ2071970.1 DUF502 domain-containing protein [Haloarcula sp. H-GB4]
MTGDDGATEAAGSTSDKNSRVYTHVRETILTGVAITVPIVVTIYVFSVVLDFVVQALDPVIAVLRWLGIIDAIESVQLVVLLIELGVYSHIVQFLTELIAILVLLAVVLFVGSVGSHRYGEAIVDFFDFVATRIPAVGTVYQSVRRMSDVMVGDGDENFQDVKLVECFGDEVYVLGFQTNRSIQTVESGVDHDNMVAMFLPLAPNPVTGGFLTYIPESNLYDVNMSVEEAVQSILTSGVATGDNSEGMGPLSLADIQNVADAGPISSLGRDGTKK